MDVGGGTTDIAVVNEGGAGNQDGSGIGGRAYTRSIDVDLASTSKKPNACVPGLGASQVAAKKEKKSRKRREDARCLDDWY